MIGCPMPSRLRFGYKYFDDTVLCDYCRYHGCDWVKATPHKHPAICLKPKKFKIADERIPNDDFTKRVEIAKRIGVYLPEKKRWQFSIRRARAFSGKELAEIIDTINIWSERNNFRLSEMIKYEERRWF
jgi:hypothetical protein